VSLMRRWKTFVSRAKPKPPKPKPKPKPPATVEPQTAQERIYREPVPVPTKKSVVISDTYAEPSVELSSALPCAPPVIPEPVLSGCDHQWRPIGSSAFNARRCMQCGLQLPIPIENPSWGERAVTRTTYAFGPDHSMTADLHKWQSWRMRRR
jgi:hypothetical protein